MTGVICSIDKLHECQGTWDKDGFFKKQSATGWNPKDSGGLVDSVNSTENPGVQAFFLASILFVFS